MTGRDSVRSDMLELAKSNRLEAFQALLSSPKYERLRSALIRVFARRGCDAPDDLADETIARVTQKLHEVASNYEGDPTRYFFGVARNVYLEQTRRPRMVSIEDVADGAILLRRVVSDEVTHDCLESCMATLARDECDLIIEYYAHDKIEKIEHRQELAKSLGLGLNALRLRTYRIRQRLARCVKNCRKKSL